MANNIDPDQTVPWKQYGQGFIFFYFHDKISSEVHLNICSRHHFQDKILAYLGLSTISCSQSY